ncbi:MAG: bcrC [Actinomycetia bacterium]|nr:bcrC [Actinomycetes bacterium]
MDWRIFKAIYGISLHHHWVGSFFNVVENASIPGMVLATVALWFFARPGGDRKWKVAAGSGLAAAALALAVDQVVHAIYDRPRPYESHQISHPWSGSTDAGFPSDHSSASLAIAFAVLMLDPLVGAVFLVAAVFIAVGRLFVGAHYPGDILASVVVAAVSAFAVVGLGRPLVVLCVRLVERVTDTLVRPLWRSSRTDP